MLSLLLNSFTSTGIPSSEAWNFHALGKGTAAAIPKEIGRVAVNTARMQRKQLFDGRSLALLRPGWRFIVAAALLAAPLAALSATGEVVLVQDGVAKTAIVAAPAVMEPDRGAAGAAPDATERGRRRLRDSVLDLARCLEKISGAKIPVVTEEQAGGPRPILIGALAERRFGPPKRKSPYKQGWRMVVGARGIGLEGESDEATSYAIYELLDRLSCRWYMPSDLGEALPTMRTVRLRQQDTSEVPKTVSRDIWYADDAFKRRNHLGGLIISAGHALEISNYITKEQLLAHPDWNAEIGGKRSVNGRFCWGNREVAVAVADGIIAQLDKSYAPTVSLSPDDGATFCQCDKCKALDTGDWDPSMNTVSITDRYVHFCNQIVERVIKKHPKVLFGFLAYVQYTRPPLREKPHPSLVPEIAPISYCRAHAMTDAICPSRRSMRGIVEGWGRAARSVSYYNYMYHLAEVAVPYPMMHQMSEELPILYRNGVTFWQPETLPNFESTLPGFYLSIRKSWHTEAEPKSVLDEFFTRFYGAAEQPMRRYWQIFDDAWTNSPEHAGCGFGYGRRFTPEVLAAARAAITASASACRTDTERARVAMQEAALSQFERFMKLRRDLFDGKLAGLEQDGRDWADAQTALGEKYAPQFAFAKTYWAPKSVGSYFFETFYQLTYKDAARIARDCVVMTSALRRWSYAVDRDNRGTALGWDRLDPAAAGWKTADSCIDTWADLDLPDYYGTVWYRTTVKLADVPAGKKTYLWLSALDGKARLLVNGQAVGEASASFAAPVSIDISAAIRANAENTLTLIATRTSINEVGTGGLLGPAILYRER